MELYIQAKSKKNLNERIASGEAVYGTNYSMFGGGGTYKLDENLPDGTVVKLYEKMVSGSPYAKSYGTWRSAKRMVVCLALMLLSAGAWAQTVKRDADGNFIHVGKSKAQPQKTGHWYKDSKGNLHDVYMTDKGRFFVIKTSAKTGKEYRYYLPLTQDGSGFPAF